MGKQFEEFKPEEDLKHPTKYEGGSKQFEKDIAQYKELTAEEERELFCKSQAGDMKAKNKLICSQLKPILHICGKPKYRSDYEELVGICISELVDRFKKDTKPSKQFNPDRGRLSVFTEWVCRSTINRYFDHKKRTVGKNVPLGDWDAPETEEILAHKELDWELACKMVEDLTGREREIVASIFGVKCKQCSLKELGLKYGLSKTQIGRIGKKALKKIGEVLNSTSEEIIKSYKRKE